MLSAYYQRRVDSDVLFRDLKIADCDSYAVHRNQYDVIKVNMQEFLSMAESVEEMLDMLRKYLLFDLREAFADVKLRDEQNLVQVMKDIYTATGHSFVILIDEWDCLFREYQSAQGALEQIREKKYGEALKEYEGNLLLAGINYDRKTKRHTCRIEKMWK